MDAHIELLDSSVYFLRVEQNANAARRAFLRYVLHEVRVPLNSICMGLQLLKDRENLESSPEEYDDALLMMTESVSYMSDTLNDVLSIQKIEEGKLVLKYEIFHISEVLRTVRHSLKGLMASKEINYIESFEESVPRRVKGDRFRIEHVLANLVSNAIKFSPRGGKINVTVSLENNTSNAGIVTKENYPSVKFAVKDEGLGISEENIKTLFTPFTQINPEMQGNQGTGIGLAICKETVELHGGVIGVKSTPRTATSQGGSIFFFILDFEVAPSTPFSSGPEHSDSESDEMMTSTMELPEVSRVPEEFTVPVRSVNFDQHDFSTWRFLLTDDVESNRKLLKMLLSKKQIQCELASDGLECLKLIDLNKGGGQFDLIFMDNMMPNMDGCTATKRLRRNGYIGIILGLTGDALHEDVNKFLICGADAVLVKPLRKNVLDKILSHFQESGFNHVPIQMIDDVPTTPLQEIVKQICGNM